MPYKEAEKRKGYLRQYWLGMGKYIKTDYETKSVFIDTSSRSDIYSWLDNGVIGGVTTNPTIMKNDGTGIDDLAEIIDILGDLPISIELTSNNHKEMIEEAILFSEMGDNVNVKVPIHGANYESNLSVIKKLEGELDIRVNTTCCMNAQQCLLASLAEATYVSLFGGRVADMGYNVVNEIEKVKSLNLPSILILGSVREPANVIDWLAAGADIVTVPPQILDKMLVNARTKETVAGFLQDAK